MREKYLGEPCLKDNFDVQLMGGGDSPRKIAEKKLEKVKLCIDLPVYLNH